MGETKLYPLWKEAKKRILERIETHRLGEPTITFDEMENILDCQKDSPPFAFAIMQLVKSLRTVDGIDLLRKTGVGYKVASESEKLDHMAKYHRSSVNKQLSGREVLDIVDPNKLDEEEKVKYERWLIKNTLQITYMNQLKLERCKPGMLEFSRDRPRMIEESKDQ
jgi:hypothetical protein